MYCAIMGDIIDSRKIIHGRSETQEKFKTAIIGINDKYSDNIESDFTITAGDSFYGLLNSPENLLEIILKIRLAIVPNQIRIGIGIGSIDTQIVRHNGNLIDGKANSTAKEAIDYLSDNKNKYESVYRTTMLKVDSSITLKKCKNYESFINTIFCTCSAAEKKWGPIHADTIRLKTEEYTQREIAANLGISQPAVQQRLISSDYYLYEYSLQTINSGIQELWKEVCNA